MSDVSGSTPSDPTPVEAAEEVLRSFNERYPSLAETFSGMEAPSGRLSARYDAESQRIVVSGLIPPADTSYEDRLLEVHEVAALASAARAKAPATSALASASTEELERQLASLRLSREMSFGYRYGNSTDPKIREAYETADGLTLRRITAIRRELESRRG